jgi:hypothetical protein
MTKTGLATAILSIVFVATARAGVVASYQFQNSLISEYGSAPSLTPINPLGLNGFQSATVFGQSRNVYRFDGNANATQNAGLTLDTTGLVSPTNYSVEFVFQFTQTPFWRKVLDFNDRSGEPGLYIDPNSKVTLLGAGTGSASFLTNTYYHLLLTNASGTNQAKAYLNGVLQFTTISNTADISNSGDLLHFFVDNAATSGTEYSDGMVALIRLYDNVLTQAEVTQKASSPFAAIPEASAWAQVSVVTCGAGLCVIARFARRRPTK